MLEARVFAALVGPAATTIPAGWTFGLATRGVYTLRRDGIGAQTLGRSPTRRRAVRAEFTSACEPIRRTDARAAVANFTSGAWGPAAARATVGGAVLALAAEDVRGAATAIAIGADLIAANVGFEAGGFTTCRKRWVAHTGRILDKVDAAGLTGCRYFPLRGARGVAASVISTAAVALSVVWTVVFPVSAPASALVAGATASSRVGHSAPATAAFAALAFPLPGAGLGIRALSQQRSTKERAEDGARGVTAGAGGAEQPG